MVSGGKKVALVTGGSRGLGKEVALALAGFGYRVAINYLKETSCSDEVVMLAKGEVLAIKADVADAAQLMDMAEEIRQSLGRLDVLVNNAGIARDALLLKTTEVEWDEVMQVNLSGCFNTAKICAPMLKEAGGGHIVNISSRSGLRGKSGQAAYSASKAALLGFTRCLASELGKYNIRINAVMPGYMPTEMGKKAAGAIKRAKEESLLASLSSPKEVASFVSWLVGTKGITGQVFSLDSRQ